MAVLLFVGALKVLMLRMKGSVKSRKHDCSVWFLARIANLLYSLRAGLPQHLYCYVASRGLKQPCVLEARR